MTRPWIVELHLLGQFEPARATKLDDVISAAAPRHRALPASLGQTRPRPNRFDLTVRAPF
jgi:hypothetical protein